MAGTVSLKQMYRLLPQFNIDPAIAPAAVSRDVDSAAVPDQAQPYVRTSGDTSQASPMPTAVSGTSVSALQSTVRQALGVLMNFTYSVNNIEVLQSCLEFVQAQIQSCRAIIAETVDVRRQQFRRTRRLVKHNIVASRLRRRLAAIKARRRAKLNHLHRKRGLKYCSCITCYTAGFQIVCLL